MQFFIEVAFLGFAAWAALFIIVLPVLYLVLGAEKLTGRQTTDTAWGVVAGIAAVAGAAIIRFGLFAPDVTEDLDGIGTVFSVAVGIGVLLLPLIMLWYTHGSRPAAR